MQNAAAALAGIRVVEQGTFITGPCAGMMLADLGADVIKVESPEGDPYRAYQGGQYSPHFQAYNRNKRSLALDMKQSADCELFQGLVREADVYIQNFRPGTARASRGGRRTAAAGQPAPGLLLHQRLRLERPLRRTSELRLGGAGAQRLSQCRGRLPATRSSSVRRWPMPSPGCTPRRASSPPWCSAGRTGRGAHVEVSMLEAMAHFAVEPFAAFFALGETPTSADRPRLAQAYILRTADERLIAIHLSSLEKFWQGLVSGARGAGAWRPTRASIRASAGSPSTRHCAWSSMHASCASRSRTGSSDCRRNDVPYAPVNRLDDVVARSAGARIWASWCRLKAPHTATRGGAAGAAVRR